MFRSLKSLVKNSYFWIGLGILVVVGAALVGIMDRVVMPAYTRHGATVVVPSVLNDDLDKATADLVPLRLNVEEIQLRKPNMPRGVVLDQNPPPGSVVKPGRHIYLTINAGDTTMVLVPRVEGISLREAQNRIMIHGLAISEVRPDSFPSPHVNTITRQIPEAGSRVPPESAVKLWVSTGLGTRQVSVPDVKDMTIERARQVLHQARLNAYIIGTKNESDISERVGNQSPAAGTAVREGVVVRLYLRSNRQPEQQ